jgi:hypothetical protein
LFSTLYYACKTFPVYVLSRSIDPKYTAVFLGTRDSLLISIRIFAKDAGTDCIHYHGLCASLATETLNGVSFDMSAKTGNERNLSFGFLPHRFLYWKTSRSRTIDPADVAAAAAEAAAVTKGRAECPITNRNDQCLCCLHRHCRN